MKLRDFLERCRRDREALERDLHLNPERYCTMGERLRNLREQIGITQLEMAELIGINFQTVASWERDESAPNWYGVLLISKTIGLSADELIDGVGPRDAEVTVKSKKQLVSVQRNTNKIKDSSASNRTPEERL